MGLSFNLGRLSPSLFTDSSLNVGIGAAPSGSYKLEVTGTGRFTSTLDATNTFTLTGVQPNNYLTYTDATSFGRILFFESATYKATIQFIGSTFTTTSRRNALEIVNGTTGDIAMGSNDTRTFYIKNGGNVGIGTSSPNLTNINRTVLDINGTSTSLLGLSVGGTAKSYLFQNGNDLFINSIAGIMAFTVETANYMSFSTTNAERMRITSGGDVGIGNINTAGYKLLVVAKDNTSSNYALVVTNNSLATLLYIRNDGYAWISQTAWAYGSDKRLKENINYIETGLEKILALKPAKFDYIDGSKDNIGWIAQDVQKVIPEAVLVNTNDERGYLSLKSDFIVPYLVKAIQELNERLNKAGL